MKFSAIIGKAVHGLKLLPNNKLTDANITDLQEYYSHDMPSPASMPAEARLKKKWDSSEETKSHNLQKTICATSNSMFPNVFCMFHLLLLILVPSAGEKTFNRKSKRTFEKKLAGNIKNDSKSFYAYVRSKQNV